MSRHLVGLFLLSSSLDSAIGGCGTGFKHIPGSWGWNGPDLTARTVKSNSECAKHCIRTSRCGGYTWFSDGGCHVYKANQHYRYWGGHLTKHLCQLQKCSCSGGKPADPPCSANEHKCKRDQCDPGYDWANDRCTRKTCKCAHGTPATGTQCPMNGVIGCVPGSCTNGFFPKGNNCVRNSPGNTVSYGDLVYLVNQYGPTSYLDTNGGSGHGGYGVETTMNLNRDASHLTSTWELVSKESKSGSVAPGDLVHLANQYGSNPSYLDTNGGSGRGGYGVETTMDLNRDALELTSTWKFVKKGYKFSLRGKHGTELATIIEGGVRSNIRLGTHKTEFFANHASIKIFYSNDNYGRDMYFESKVPTTIEHLQKFVGWGCGLPNEHVYCNTVRDGTFAWGGWYQVQFRSNY